uniref:Uncharacterized protein n=1 Tax=Anguilla anguilla TaxID=7936 RepID=A0A0E9W2R9_ANGAN
MARFVHLSVFVKGSLNCTFKVKRSAAHCYSLTAVLF